MSGTSLDGLDLATCSFSAQGYTVLHAKTISYSDDWKQKLATAQNRSAFEIFQLHAEFGRFIGQALKSFFDETGVVPEAVASHGHTVFHQPHLGFSTQIGCGATISAVTGLTTVCDFRSKDVALGGQGAPLVPIGDELLFSQYEACLNIGGIANISFRQHNQRIAFDICVANMVLNYLANQVGQPYDNGGVLAQSGRVNANILAAVEALDFYKLQGARSIGREWFETYFSEFLTQDTVHNLLATFTEHAARRIAAVLNENKLKSVCITGGGAYNQHLIQRLQAQTEATLTVPDTTTVEFKEALIFAFLGYLRLDGKINTLNTVTGAQASSVGGAVYTKT